VNHYRLVVMDDQKTGHITRTPDRLFPATQCTAPKNSAYCRDCCKSRRQLAEMDLANIEHLISIMLR